MSSRFVRPWRPRAADWDRAAATHLLRRAGFGPALGEVERALEDGYDATLARVFEPAGHDPALLGGIQGLLALERIDLLAAWWMSLVLEGGAPLDERLTLFWHDHFATSHEKVDDVRMMHRQNTVLRERGAGGFRELLHAIAKDPAMLVWLDGNENKRGQANENFAREVMELFGLGIGNYTERDVQEAARAFTGWGTSGRGYVFRDDDHDPGTKEIFGERGAYRGEDVVELVLDHPACARHVARRLLKEFCVASPSEADVDAVAAELVRRDWQVRSTVRTILASEGFWSDEVRRSRIAGPVELIASSVRALGARVAPARAAEAADHMGQALFRPPTVKGWDGGRTWINAGTWVARHNLLSDLARAHTDDVEGVRVDLAEAFDGPRSASAAARRAVEVLTPDLVGTPFADRIESAAREARDLDRALVVSTALVLTSPEYQLV